MQSDKSITEICEPSQRRTTCSLSVDGFAQQEAKDLQVINSSSYNLSFVVPASEPHKVTTKRVKKDALWKPLLRGFRIYLRRAL